MKPVPIIRIETPTAAPIQGDGSYVLYWMIGARRTTWSFGLQRAVQRARQLEKPLVVLEALRCDAPWASERTHRFVLDGMADNARRLDRPGILYYPYVEPAPGAGKGLLAMLAHRACLVITDAFPCFFLPRMVDAAVRSIPGRKFEIVDSNGLLPLRAADREFTTAHSFRRFLQKTLREHLEEFPEADPLKAAPLDGTPVLPREVRSRWPRASQALLEGRESLAQLPIDHRVGPVETRGGSVAAAAALKRFLGVLPRYADEHGAPEADVTSRLSPYLHFGHIAAHTVFHAVMRGEDWTPRDLAAKPSGAREGWWGVSPAAESFLDELVTWRELGFNVCAQRQDYDRYGSLPAWARGTLEAHASDRREHVYTREQFEAAATHDPLWNAAQMQLVREGRIHNYLRMLWGKKILEWTRSPRQALDIMIELNNTWALDGRDPNSYSGIFWVLGRFDRPWAPERPVFGSIRWMSSANTARKYRVREYLKRYAGGGDAHVSGGADADAGAVADARTKRKVSESPRTSPRSARTSRRQPAPSRYRHRS